MRVLELERELGRCGPGSEGRREMDEIKRRSMAASAPGMHLAGPFQGRPPDPARTMKSDFVDRWAGRGVSTHRRSPPTNDEEKRKTTMDINKLTLKSQEALRPPTLATRTTISRWRRPICLGALLGQTEGVIFPLLQKLGVAPQRCAQVDGLLDASRRCTDRSRCICRRDEAVLETAFSEAEALGRRIRLDRAPAPALSGRA